MRWRRILLAGGVLVLVALGVLWANAWSLLGRMQESRDGEAEIVLSPLRETVYLIEATLGGSRPFSYVASVASLGPDGAFLVDPMVSATLAKKIDTALRERGAPVRYVANTHAHPDHTRGNVAFDDGPQLIAHRDAAREMAQRLRPFAWLPATDPLPAEAIPAVVFSESHSVEMNGEHITLRHFGPGHTAGDAFVFFERARVVHVGDTFLGGGGRAVAAPISGGSFQGLEHALGELVASVPADTIVVGGHGNLGEVWTVADVEQYRAILRAALQWVAEVGANGEPSDADFTEHALAGWQDWAGDESPEPLLRAIWEAESAL